jgi:hypothetical protein
MHDGNVVGNRCGLDCRSLDGPIVTASNEDPFANTGHTLRSWLWAWLAGEDLFEQMFEPGPSRKGINPLTKEPMVFRSTGKPRASAGREVDPRWRGSVGVDLFHPAG